MIRMIWAQTSQGVIGRDGTMPWHCPEDLAHFRQTTQGHILVMGRKTWESLPRKPLPNRQHVVLTRQALSDLIPDQPDNVKVVHDIEALITWLKDNAQQDIMIMGGGQLYQALLPYAQELIITELALDVEGDTYAPTIPSEQWVKVNTQALTATEHRIVYWQRSKM